MDGRRGDRKRVERCVKHNSVVETEYDDVDVKEVHVVQILPSRPIKDEEHVYADRDLPRSSSSHSLLSICSGDANVDTTTAPAIRRDLKPGRRKIRLDTKAPTEETEGRWREVFEQDDVLCSSRCSVDKTSFTWPGDDTNSCKKGRDKRSHVKADKIHNTSSSLFEIDLTHHSNQRHLLAADIPNKELRSAHTQVPHEWPQTKKASNKHNFPPVQKPPQTYSTEGWYVGVCNRIDAEHALHLVNKDGAFLVRDSTINTIAEPLVLAVYHDKKVYNVKIRYIERTCTFALGKGRGPNVMFHSVEEMIRFHTISPLPLTNGRYATGSKNCVLTYPVTKGDVDKLLQ
ncbi:cytokine-dependent hematopoietic cell linker [Gouania willdenowi]|uniref:cytokine-dependent hematopoietic cell linker n=1 Tax=Gouania willdenowi TaxID=441366 RepID=UPI0010550512|nr:cytokine-dependent hematopoietic cell linker [Gouania willdenowi]XP_028315731.1 cytokine-dependent hematopoietic cell linker [Gouania willdenowi]XP_028315732.1 cytokine-dependent hematopoietic cell linker [Gouania willdenowi]